MNSIISSPWRPERSAGALEQTHVPPGGCDFQPEPGQWVRFAVSAARFPSRKIRFVLATTALLGCLGGLLVPFLSLGIAAVLVYVGAHLGLAAVAAAHTAPATTFWACPKGVRLGNGTFIPRHHVNYLVCRDVLHGPVLISGIGKAGLFLSTARKPLGWLYRCLLAPIAFQVELDLGGRVHVLAGRMPRATARQVHETLSRVLKLSP